MENNRQTRQSIQRDTKRTCNMLTLIRYMHKELKESTFKNKWQTNRSKVTQTRRQTEREMEIEKRTFESIFLQGISVIYKVSQKTRNPSYKAITPLLLHTKSTRNHLIGIWRDQMYCSLGQSIPKPLPHPQSRLSARRADRAHPTIQALLHLIGGRFFDWRVVKLMAANRHIGGGSDHWLW